MCLPLLMKLSGHQSQKIRFICKNLRSQTRGVVKSVTDSKGWVYGESKSFNGWRREEGGGGAEHPTSSVIPTIQAMSGLAQLRWSSIRHRMKIINADITCEPLPSSSFVGKRCPDELALFICASEQTWHDEGGAYSTLPLSYSAQVSVDRMYLFTIYIAQRSDLQSLFQKRDNDVVEVSILLLLLAVRLMSLFCRL